MSKLFFLNGIKAPGRVHTKDLGEVNLEDLTDDQAMKLYKEGCPYLAPSPEGFKKLYPDSSPIKVSKLDPKPAGKKTRKK